MIKLALPLALAFAGTAALAQEAATDAATGAAPAEEGMETGAEAAETPMLNYMAVMSTSMEMMPSDSTGDADADFLLMMIPHHQSAVDMARIALEIGDDPEVQALAQEVIASQEAEITRMQEMLAAMDVQPAAAQEAPASE